ncbi:receptor-type guanylate cyclase Gyc76C [Trichonephila clavata]|uniref:Receptor-type guanylate cyclase Gyc76C n=1 Tax=Trichonephila clavata TaxID=2740835 RepID=A0A8X6LDE1_TRICU|nr:receptor-type guanylate cyclase Gyc76C [Trichonephila clavata]
MANRKYWVQWSHWSMAQLLKLIMTLLGVFLICNSKVGVKGETFTIGYMTNMQGRTNTQKQGIVISGAISYALDVVNNNASFLNGHKLQMIYNDTEGDTLLGTYVTIQQWREGAIAFFGPEDSCAVEATVAASLNLPMISYVSTFLH